MDDSISGVELAAAPPPPKKQKVAEYEANASTRLAKIKELKTLRINHPNLKIGLTAELDREFAAMTDEELQTLGENYHLELTGAKPFATGCAFATILGRVGEAFLGLEGFTTRLTTDSHLVANLDQSLPFTFANHVPQLNAAMSFGIHVVNAFSEGRRWQHPPPPTPQVLSATPPGSSL